MRLAYFDCFSGASGDMILGALLDAGLGFKELKEELGRLPLTGYELSAEPAKRNGVAGTRFVVCTHAEQAPASGHHPQGHPRNLGDIRQIIESSSLPERVRSLSLSIFTRLAEAEARVHRTSPDQIHFHEVGAVDAILDIVGAVTALHLLGVQKVLASELITGYGFVDCAHGRLPVPAPATAELIRSIPSRSGEVEKELLTPTGAAILTTLASGFGPRPPFTVQAVGYGAGTYEFPNHPNLLRVLIGEELDRGECDQVWMVETNLDDISPQAIGYVSDRLLRAGALDVFSIPAQMKKSRPGVLLSVLCASESLEAVEKLLLEETTTFGVRRYPVQRRKLDREVVTLKISFGEVRVKLGRLGGRPIKASPEYDDCCRLAEAAGVPFRDVYEAATRQASQLLRP